MARSCLTPTAVLLHALDEADHDPSIAEHLPSCAQCRESVTETRRLLHATTALPDRLAGDCLDEVTISRFAAEGMRGPEAARAADHLASCASCRGNLVGLLELLSDPAVAAEVRRLEAVPGRPGRRVLAVAGAVAAVALLVLMVRSPAPERPLDHRGPTLTAADAPALLLPDGDVAEASAFEWSSVIGADRYRLTLFRDDGRVLFEQETQDTTVALPDTVGLAPAVTYYWKVEARTGWDRWTASELIPFRIVSPSDPDSLQALARHLADSALAREIRRRPLEIRDAFTAALKRAAASAAADADQELAVVQRLAAAYAIAWSDNYLVREAGRFASWSPRQRRERVMADSLRREGNRAFGQDGAAAAIAIWRRAYGTSRAIADTAGMAAALGNIGAGFARDGEADSAGAALATAQHLAASVGDIRVEGNATAELAGLSEEQGDLGAATRYYERAVELRRLIGDSRGQASDYNNLAGLSRSAGDFDGARRQLEQALALNRADGRDDAVAINQTNLAALAMLSGDFERAERLQRDAVAVWQRLRLWADLADGERSLGEIGVRRGDYTAAQRHFRSALLIYRRTGPPGAAVAVQRQWAAARAAQGDLQGAWDQLDAARREADHADVAPDERSALALARADLAVQLNRYPEAGRLYAQARLLARQAGDRSAEAEASKGEGILALEQDNAPRALEQFGIALAAEQAAGDARSAAITRLWIGAANLQRGDTVTARSELARAARDLARLGDPVASGAALGEQGALEMGAGRRAAADSLYRSGLQRVGDRVAPDVTWQLHAGLAAVRRDRGLKDAAAAEYRKAIADAERAGRSLTLPERRSGYLADKRDIYVEAALLERTRGHTDSAFVVSERARAAELLELLGEGRVIATDTAPALVAREQDLRRHISGLTRTLEGVTERNGTRGPDLSRESAVSREALLQAQESYADLMLEIRERAPRHNGLLTPSPAAWTDVARHLSRDEAFIEYLTGDNGTVAFVITRDTLATVAIDASRGDLARLIDFARAALLPATGHGPALWRAPLQQLHRELVTPIEASGLLAGKRRLIIVPHAELNYLPFAALLSDGTPARYLIERYELSLTPSASVWLALGDRQYAAASAGVLAMAPRPDLLPASRGEVAAVAHILGRDVHSLVGRDASEAALRREASGRRIIHLATYGILNKQNPMFSFLELARDAGAPEDGQLEVHEVFGMRLSADLVVLSACQTGLGSGAIGDVPAGDDWVGLTRAFLYAGAHHVMASLWAVQDNATARLMEQFYRAYAGWPDPTRALALAQRSLINDRATADPYLWAGFVVAGGR
ncbi:MAG TPA: CHAT domain-containing protein [Gemmatimonadales bacterium]|nr:CHAT domain-containing protein [Gemmatimonadales bacterium]